MGIGLGLLHQLEPGDAGDARRALFDGDDQRPGADLGNLHEQEQPVYANTSLKSSSNTLRTSGTSKRLKLSKLPSSRTTTTFSPQTSDEVPEMAMLRRRQC